MDKIYSEKNKTFETLKTIKSDVTGMKEIINTMNGTLSLTID